MKRIGKESTFLCGLIAAVLIPVFGFGQPAVLPPSVAGGPRGTFAALPTPFRPLGSALGDRLFSYGKERRTLVGMMTQAGQTYPCTLIQELPNKFRVDGGGGSLPVTVAFDGKDEWTSNGTLTEQDQDMLESLFDDAPEGLLFSVLNGGATRLLIHHGRIDDGSSRNYSGPLVTVYQLVAPAISRADQRQKQLYFDSESGLPIQIRYRIQRSDGRTAFIETSFGNWTTTNGQFTPGKVIRSEDGKSVFTFQASSARFDAASNDGAFTKK